MDSDSALGEKTVLDPPRLGLPVENPDFEMADVVEVEDAIVPFAGSETDGILPKDTSFGDPETRDANLSGARRVASLSTPEYDGPCRSPSQESFPVDGPLVEDSEMSNLKADQPESVASLGSTEAHPTTGGKTIWNTILPESQEENIDQGLSQPKDRLDALDVDFASGGQIPIPISPEWEEWEDSEDESEDAIGALSTDIRADFERVLNKPLDFQGSFYFHKTYSEFPNPILRLGSLGHIGLPLSSREAEHIKVHCVQAPFGKGERTLVDKSVRDTWEMDASQVHFDNPAWKTFMVQVSQEVCLKLGLAAKQVSTVRCEPYKLLLYETGSHFLPHQDTEKTKGMFATVIVVLPSPFQGGAAHLSHGDLSTIVDSSPCSLSNVSVLAWYTDVLHEIKPITGGHRLAVAFNLIQTASSRPELPKTDDHLRKLKHVLLSWKQRTDVPDKLMYLLQHKYSLASLRGDCLKGADAYKVALLQSLAKQLDFDVGLANVECHVVGYGDDDFGHRGGYGSEDDDDVGMAEVEEQTMTISNLVDLEGQHIQKEVECKEDDSEFCPMGLRDEVEAGNPDEREYEGYQGNGAGSLELWYRRTVLVIWPHRHNAEMKYGTNPGRALAILTSAAKPDDECRLIARFLLRGIASGRFGPKTVQGLCKTACHWNNLTLWLKTISLCDGTQILNTISARRIVNAIEVFGFDKRMQSILESILSETPSNTERFKLLDEIMARAGTDRVENSWLARQRYRVMKTLKKPNRGEEDLLVRLAVEGGGVPFLQSTILPQVISMADTDFLMAFSARLVIEQSLLQTEEFILATRNIVRNLLKLAIERTNFAPSPPTSAPAYSFIEACVKCSHADLVELVVDKLVDLSDLSPATAWMQTSGVLIPLIPRLIASDRPIPGLVKLCRVTIEQYMKQPGSIPPTEAELSTVLDAVVGAQDSAMLSKIADRLSTLAPSEALCRSLIKNLRSREGLLNLDNEGGISISGICMQSLQNLVQRTQYGSDLSLIVRHLQLCLSTDNASVLLHLFPRLLSPAVTSKPYISGVLLPLVHNIQAELASWKISSTSEPFSAVLKQIFELYASKVLGPPKSSDHSSLLMGVKKISCTCVNCAALVKFLLQSQDRQLRLARIGMNQRKHVEENLGKFVGYRAANWGTIKTSPQGLEVNKSDLLYSSIVWKAHQAKLKEALGVVSTSDETILRDIFGGDASYKQFANSMGQDTASEAGPSGPPAKKRRMSASTEVIDLCSP